jgi:hypothetical protein
MSSRCGQEQLNPYEQLIDQFLFSFTGQQTVGVCRNNYIQRIFLHSVSFLSSRPSPGS